MAKNYLLPAGSLKSVKRYLISQTVHFYDCNVIVSAPVNSTIVLINICKIRSAAQLVKECFRYYDVPDGFINWSVIVTSFRVHQSIQLILLYYRIFAKIRFDAQFVIKERLRYHDVPRQLSSTFYCSQTH